MTQRQMVNRLKVLLQAKELSGNLHSNTLSTLRGISVQGGGQGQHFPVTTVHVSAQGSAFLYQTIGLHSCPGKREQMVAGSSRPFPGSEAHVAHCQR